MHLACACLVWSFEVHYQMRSVVLLVGGVLGHAPLGVTNCVCPRGSVAALGVVVLVVLGGA